MTDADPQSDPFYKFEHFFELSPDLLCIASYDGYFKRINPAVSKLLGYTNEELSSKPISEFVYEEDKEITRVTRDVMTTSNSILNFENRYLTKSGEIVWLSWTSMPVESQQLVYAVAKNVTTRKQLEHERNEHLAHLTKINKELKQLSYTTSHDLRSPVNNILSIFDLLDLSKITDEETLEYIDILKSLTLNLSETLNASVDKLIQKDKLNIPVDDLNFQENLGPVLRSINSIIENSKANIITDFSGLENIHFNKAYLESIFLNLITNSIKYAQPNIPPIITIKSAINNDIKQLIISDNGMGLDMANVKDKIFGLNQKFHSHSDSKGIGLYLVYNHITSLGGTIDVESEIDRGTKFIISFCQSDA